MGALGPLRESPLLDTFFSAYALAQEMRCFDALAELYAALNEEDVLFGLWKRRCAAPETRSALAYLQHGNAEAAQDAFTEAMEKAAKPFDSGVNSPPRPIDGSRWPADFLHRGHLALRAPRLSGRETLTTHRVLLQMRRPSR